MTFGTDCAVDTLTDWNWWMWRDRLEAILTVFSFICGPVSGSGNDVMIAREK